VRDEPNIVKNLPRRRRDAGETRIKGRDRDMYPRRGMRNHLGHVERQCVPSTQEITDVSPTAGAMKGIKTYIAVFPWEVMHRTGTLNLIEILKKTIFVHHMNTGKREPTARGEWKLADGAVLRLRGPRRDGSSRARGLGRR